MSMDVATSTFDYTSLGNLSGVVQGIAQRVRTRMKRAAEDIIEIGQSLKEAKGFLKHGQFGEWLKMEFDWDLRTAQRFIAVADRFAEIRQNVVFGPSVLYLLSSDSVPDSAVAEVISRAESGEKITVAAAKEIADRHTSESDDEPPDEDEAGDSDDGGFGAEPDQPFTVAVFGRLVESAIDRVLKKVPSPWHQLLAEKLETLAAQIRETGGFLRT